MAAPSISKWVASGGAAGGLVRAPLQHTFNQRWVAMPAAMPLQMFDTAREAVTRPSFCMPLKCRVG